MIRTLLWIVILGFSADLSAIGLGRLVVNSALNEQFDAEISISSIEADVLKALKIGLASQSDFKRAGIIADPVLRGLTFDVVEGETGPWIRVLSNEPIRVPFLHFLVAIEWSGGKIIREYTALLDPPGYHTVAGQPIEPPRAVIDKQVLRPGETYGPVRSGETLMGIAADIEAGKSTSIYQRMFALIHANPEAFIRGNMNLLREGASLKIPSTKSMHRISKILAKEEYSRQLSEWIAYHDDVEEGVAKSGERLWVSFLAGEKETEIDDETLAKQASEEAEKTVETEKEVTAAEPTVSIEIDETSTEPVAGLPKASVTGNYVLRIVQPERESETSRLAQTVSIDDSSSGVSIKADQVSSPEGLGEKLVLLEESLASKELENEKLLRQITLLAEQIEKSARLIAIQDEALALVQQQASGQAQTGSSDSKLDSSGQEIDSKSGTQASDEAELPAKEASSQGASEQAVTTPSVDQATSSTADVDTKQSDGTGKKSDSNQGSATEAKAPVPDQTVVANLDSESSIEKADEGPESVATNASEPAAEVTTVKQPRDQIPISLAEKERNWWDLGKFVPQARGPMVTYGAGLALLLGLLLLVMRRRRISEDDFEDDFDDELDHSAADDSGSANLERSESVAMPESSVVPPDTYEEIEAQPAMSIGSGFVTEAETAQGVSVQSDEVDPIAESEIYLAYGRNDQAEQVLTDAIRGSPDRLELKIKLLEVFQAQGNVEGFTSMAEMLGTQIDHGSAEWAQIVRMAREVAPDNAKLQDDTIADSAPETPGDSATQGEVQEITFDTISDGGTPAAKDTVPQDEIQEIAFDPVSEGGAEVAEESAPQDELQDIEFDLSEPEETPKPEPNQSENLEETPAADPIDDGIEFILEPEGELSQAQESETVLQDEPTDMDSLEQASDTDVGTRLDLARAYIEMGDAAAARTLLEEVKQLGTPSEREEAESLMANLLADTD